MENHWNKKVCWDILPGIIDFKHIFYEAIQNLILCIKKIF
jgi:hypothetical protein